MNHSDNNPLAAMRALSRTLDSEMKSTERARAIGECSWEHPLLNLADAVLAANDKLDLNTLTNLEKTKAGIMRQRAEDIKAYYAPLPAPKPIAPEAYERVRERLAYAMGWT